MTCGSDPSSGADRGLMSYERKEGHSDEEHIFRPGKVVLPQQVPVSSASWEDTQHSGARNLIHSSGGAVSGCRTFTRSFGQPAPRTLRLP